jgi:hypothetical protein
LPDAGRFPATGISRHSAYQNGRQGYLLALPISWNPGVIIPNGSGAGEVSRRVREIIRQACSELGETITSVRSDHCCVEVKNTKFRYRQIF